jgi:Domain of unknown function (DUF4390)
MSNPDDAFIIEPIMKRTIVRAAAFFFAMLLLVMPGAAFCQDARLENIIVTNTRDNLLLYLTAKDAFSPKIIKAIQSGVPVTFTYHIKLYHVRGFWFDKKIAELRVTHTLKYDNLKKEYMLTRSWEDNRPLIVKTLDEAQKLMTEVDSLNVVPLKRLEKGQQYQIQAKAELNKMTLPFYLHYVLFFVSFWDTETDWYTIDFIY